jgi:hypothetical protein
VNTIDRPAFPGNGWSGMSVRDVFAAQVVGAMDLKWASQVYIGKASADVIAKNAFLIANAMMRESLNKPEDQ